MQRKAADAMSCTPDPRPGSAGETIAPENSTRPGSSDDTIAPVKPTLEPAATIAPVSTKPSPAETIAPGPASPAETIAPSSAPASGPASPGATIDFSLPPPGLNATIDSIPSLSAGSRASAAPPRPEVEGYTILSELGRGGMGVVYKARQKKLNRIVALKMVLAGAHAGPDQLARFYIEAEAVAHLQQPHIVQIHEVGEHGGLPYFSLEYVDGGCLSDRIDGKPQPVKDAAHMVELLARAIGYAHQQGIIHRDLKPANVLLTKEGEPKITDFGLAKRLESDSGQTKSGTLMGTPNYMAPEQARGLAKEVGPLADVYALGVILYEMLVGRTPFLGTSILDTLQQVRNQEPVPPSRLQPKVPRDIETICLKCLDKEPAKRYESAIAMADDLHRFLAGEPILARPVALPERVWRWCQRNRRVAALAAAVLLLLVSLAIGGPVAALLIGQQKALAIKNEKAARAAQALAQANEEKEKAARHEADENARVAAEQSRLALGALQTLVTSVSKLRDTAATQNIKQALLRSGIDGLRKVASSTQSAKSAMMADAHQQMGDIFESVGQLQDARKEYEVNHAIRKSLVDAAPEQLEPRRELALAVSRLGNISWLESNAQRARQHYEEALRLREAIAGEQPQNEQAQIDLATSFVAMGNVSEPELAKGFYTRALQLRQEIAEHAAPATRDNRRRDVWVMARIQCDWSVKQLDFEGACKYAEAALDQASALLKDHPDSPRAKADLAASYELLAVAKSLAGDAAGGKSNNELALAIVRPLADEDPQNIAVQASLALVLARLGEHREAAAKADALRKLAPRNVSVHYNAACSYARCSSAVAAGRTAGDLLDEERNLADAYANQAVEALGQAIKIGFKDLDGMKSDHDLAVLANHPGFLALLSSGKK